MRDLPLLSSLAFGESASLTDAVLKTLGLNSFMVVIIVLANHCRVRSFNFGYLVVYANVAILGLFAGTDSFSGGVSAYSLEGLLLFLRVGLLEFLSYLLMCAATVPLTMYYADAWRGEEFQRKRSFREVTLSRTELGMLVVAAVLLVTAALGEWWTLLPT